eukprot:scaffold154396_cov73-Cyclotella_meneghiniana.AAC.2
MTETRPIKYWRMLELNWIMDCIQHSSMLFNAVLGDRQIEETGFGVQNTELRSRSGGAGTGTKQGGHGCPGR